MPELPFRYSPIVTRPPLRLPDGARLAFYLAVNVEHHEPGKPAMSLAQATAMAFPDPLNYGWRDYGVRVGIWRMIEAFDRLGLPVSAALNADVCSAYPEIVAAGIERGWCWLAHGKNNSTFHVGLEEDEERTVLREVVGTIEHATGMRPRGWLGPALTETWSTPRLLAEIGIDYLLDWANDDQPYPLEVPRGRMVSLPYASEVNDIPAFLLHGQSGAEFERSIVDAVDVLTEEGEHTARVIGVGVHPYLAGQPQRIRYLERALEHVLGKAGVWVTTADAIVDWYYEALAEPPVSGAG